METDPSKCPVIPELDKLVATRDALFKRALLMFSGKVKDLAIKYDTFRLESGMGGLWVEIELLTWSEDTERYGLKVWNAAEFTDFYELGDNGIKRHWNVDKTIDDYRIPDPDATRFRGLVRDLQAIVDIDKQFLASGCFGTKPLCGSIKLD